MAILWVAWVSTAMATGAVEFPSKCRNWHLLVISVEGSVQTRTASGWATLEPGSELCNGAFIQIRGSSQATILLPDKSVLHLNEYTRLALVGFEGNGGTWADIVDYVIRVFREDPRSLRATTPYANAGLDGSDYALAATSSASVVVDDAQDGALFAPWAEARRTPAVEDAWLIQSGDPDSGMGDPANIAAHKDQRCRAYRRSNPGQQ